MRLQLISEEQSRKVHSSALKLLNELGIHVMDDSTRRRLLQEGCREGEDERILFPDEVVDKVLSTIPPKMVIYDRNGEIAVDLTRRCYKTHDFMMDDHTLNHMKIEMRGSSLFPRNSLDGWKGDGSPSIGKRIREKLQDLLASQ